MSLIFGSRREEDYDAFSVLESARAFFRKIVIGTAALAALALAGWALYRFPAVARTLFGLAIAICALAAFAMFTAYLDQGDDSTYAEPERSGFKKWLACEWWWHVALLFIVGSVLYEWGMSAKEKLDRATRFEKWDVPIGAITVAISLGVIALFVGWWLVAYFAQPIYAE